MAGGANQSKVLFETKTIQKFIINNYSNLINNKQNIINDINFTLIDFDARIALQHCKLYNPKITPGGYFEGVIFDYYDFEYRNFKDTKEPNNSVYNEIIKINNWGCMMQEKGILENYFVVYYIREKVK